MEYRRPYNSRRNLVLGQPNFTSNTANNGGIGASTLSNPQGAYSDGTRLYIADYSNFRILVWNSIPTTTQQPANLVLGQPTMATAIANNGGVTSGTLSGPWYIFGTSNLLFISDGPNDRIVTFPAP